MINFFKAYLKSMRLYYAFITGIAGWLGVAFYEHIGTDFKTVEILPSVEKKFVIILLLFLSWGINQIINDFLGLKEDRINAPERPMVTGELNVKGALALTAFFLVLTGLVTWFYLEPIALIPLVLGVILNIVYEYAKGFGLLGNVMFGFMITMCPIFGFLASGPTGAPYFTKSRISSLLLIWLINGVMTYFTFFKDYKGDKKSGKRTMVVKYGIKKARYIGLFLSILPALFFIVIYKNNFIIARVNNIFIILSLVTIFLHLWTGFSYFKNPTGDKTYYSLAINFRACTCSHATLMALFNKELALVLFIFSYVFVGFLFDLYPNAKA